MIDDIDFEQYKKYKEYIENEMFNFNLLGIPKERLNENKDERNIKQILKIQENIK